MKVLSRSRSSALCGPGVLALERHVRRRACKTLNEPDFDHRMPCHPQPAGYAVQGIHHPSWKIDIHPLCPCSTRLALDKSKAPVMSKPSSKLLSETFSFYTVPLLLCAHDARIPIGQGSPGMQLRLTHAFRPLARSPETAVGGKCVFCSVVRHRLVVACEFHRSQPSGRTMDARI